MVTGTLDWAATLGTTGTTALGAMPDGTWALI